MSVQSLLVALGTQDVKSSRNHQSLWLSLGGLANVLSEKVGHYGVMLHFC